MAASSNIMEYVRGIFGLLVLIGIATVLSANRKAIPWKTVVYGLGAQIVLAICILHFSWVRSLFEIIGIAFTSMLDFTEAGSNFLFGSLMDTSSIGFVFALQVLPTIIFFSALTSVLFYWGILQKVVKGLAWLMTKTLKISGAESLSVAGNIFLGQTEAPMMIRPYLPKMNKSEILLVMIGGMATVAGGVLAAYVGFLAGDDSEQRLFFAKHLLAASVLAAPGAVVVSKILLPQSEAIDESLNVAHIDSGDNFLDALTSGTSEGLKLALNVGAMLLVFFAMLALVNNILFKVGEVTTINGWVTEVSDGNFFALSLEFILGYIFAPLMWLIGVTDQDMVQLGRLLGEKIIASEFVGYESLSRLKASGAIGERSIIMATYMLCGFANFASIGIQIGGIGGMAPSQKVMLSKLGFKALVGGTLASLLSTTVVGMLL